MKEKRQIFAPRRVNLIGDHTDYNGGLVFPAALNMCTCLTIGPAEDDCFHFSSENDPTAFSFRKEELAQRQHSWVNYPLGVLKEFCPELDFLAERAQQFPGVLGSRMTGAGFGGCTVTLIAENQVDAFVQEIGEAYEQQFQIKADFYMAEIGDGAGKL